MEPWLSCEAAVCNCACAGTWVTTDATLAHADATGTGSAPTPQLVARYAAHTPVKDKDFPAIIDRALRAVKESSTLQSYDVVPSMLTDQYDLTGWFQVMCPFCVSLNVCLHASCLNHV